jgi:HK97 family phage portal protein
MSLFDRLLGREQKALTVSERGELPGLASLQYTKHSFTPVTNFTQAYRLWKENPVAQGCTQAYALTMPEAYLAVRQDEQFVYDHPVSQLFAGSSWRLSMATAMTYLCIGGNVYYHKLRNNAGAVIELRPYSDANFAPVLDEYGNIRAYHYYNGSNTWEVAKDDVVHIRGFWVDPAFSYAGGSPIVLASTTIESYNEASGTIFSIHKNDAMPKTLVIYDEELSPDQISLAERSFKRKYGGERRGSVGHMWGVKSVERLALDYQELGMESTFSQYEARICGVYRVHPIIAYTYAGIMSSTYSNAEQASKDFTDMVRVPLWQMIADQINAQFAIPEFGVEVAFDLSTVEALKPSVESQQTTAIAAFTAGVLTQDEARETFGLMPLGATPEVVTASRDKRVQTKQLQTKQYDDIDFNPPQAVREEAAQGLEWREEFGRGGTEVGVARARDLSNGRIISPETARRMKAYFLRHEIDKEAEGWNDDENGYPSAGRIAWALWGGDPGFAWVDDIVTRMDAEDAEYEDGIDNDNDSEGGESSGLAPFRSDAIDDAVFFKAVDDISEKWAKRIATAFAKEAAKLEAELIGNVKSRGAVMTKQEGDPFDVEDWTARFLSATESEREGLVEEMVKAASSDVDAEDGEYGKARREGIDESSQKIASSIGTIREDVRFILNNSGGLSGEEIAALLRSKFAEITTARANAIGRTTATATTGKTQSAVWKTVSDRESDPDRKIVRQWVSFPGARDAHSGANGQFEDLDTGFFTVGGEQTEYPAGPGLSAKNAVNCRCITRARRRADYDRLTTSPL